MKPYLSVLGLFHLPTYGMFVATGILVGTWLATRLARRAQLPEGFALDAVFYVVLAGLAGGRLTYMAIEWRATLRDPVAALFNSGGMVFLGGFFCGLAALYAYCRFKKVPFALVADVFAPAVALAHCFGRIGCLFAGCCYGAPAHGWLGHLIAIRYPRLTGPDGAITGSWPYLDHLEQGWVTTADAYSLPVYATPILEALFNLGLAAALLWLWRRRRFDGHIALVYVMAYSVARFLLEFLRGDQIRGFFGALSTSQWLSLFALAGAFAIYWRRQASARAATNNDPCNT
ncbi:MAG: prolipoprotein diacylglyceryl transferase [Candidatus Sumerlaea sp.]|jgi:phosphatidylglycerol:prolipoprotein diacylglycerol transferase|uniref:Phosphatidylglycerol--prolipoprotein diacylglyceryl transferase n=1 Tax=Sumerlaea chitinivorans TaxID=2250252 RepID=A0A2Z4Y537_SUMC1|nr:Prolipoprotein diacylglyceryl transferase [Candidatus Sumerlaea chitinivorans]GIX44049.1 MAG: prolipoprotein diacylglyceryl transferase [Candidatus Sumerlaea sp.]